MTETFGPKLVAPDEGKTVLLFGVRFSYKVVSADSGGSLAVVGVEIPAGTLVKPHNHWPPGPRELPRCPSQRPRGTAGSGAKMVAFVPGQRDLVPYSHRLLARTL